MSAEFTVAQAQACLHAALVDEVASIGGMTVAIQEMGGSEDTWSRRLAGTHDWQGKEIATLIAAGHRRMGRSLVHQRVAALLDGAACTAGDSRSAMGDAQAVLPALLAEAQRMAQAVKDGHITRAEARSLLKGIPALIRMLEKLQVDLSAFLRS